MPESETRATQLENVLRAILDNAVLADFDEPRDEYHVDRDVIDEARALLDGESSPGD